MSVFTIPKKRYSKNTISICIPWAIFIIGHFSTKIWIFDSLFLPKMNGCVIRTSCFGSKDLNFILWIGYSKSLANSSYSHNFNPSDKFVSRFNFIENYGNTRDLPSSIGVSYTGERSDELNSLHNSSKKS